MLHIVNKSPFSSSTLDECLNVAQGGALLLIEDAVYAATAGSAYESRLREALAKFRVFVLQPDLEARGMGGSLLEGISPIDYSGFVDLVVENLNCQSWL
jgi:tRNA 2-thiouridine synthesizing protein B